MGPSASHREKSKVQSEGSFRLRMPLVAAARLHCLRPATFASRPWLITCLTTTLTGTTPLSATDAVSLANLPDAALHAVALVWCCGHGLVLNYTDLEKNGQTTDSVTTTTDCRDSGTLGSRPSASPGVGRTRESNCYSRSVPALVRFLYFWHWAGVATVWRVSVRAWVCVQVCLYLVPCCKDRVWLSTNSEGQTFVDKKPFTRSRCRIKRPLLHPSQRLSSWRGPFGAKPSFVDALCGSLKSLAVARESAPGAFGAVAELDLDSVCGSDELAEVCGSFWWQDLDVHTFALLPCCLSDFWLFK